MTVTLVTQPAAMHAFKNSDLDEVHSLSRYCFSYSSLGGLHLLFLSCCAQIMYHDNLASLCPRISNPEATSIIRPMDIYQELCRMKGPS